MGEQKQRKLNTGYAQKPNPLSWLVRDAPEYEERKKRTQFVPPALSIKDVHAAVPRHLFERNTAKGLYYVLRHVGLSALFYVFASKIDQVSWSFAATLGWGASGRNLVSWACWIMYWFWQSVSFAGMWTLGTPTLTVAPLNSHLLRSSCRPRGMTTLVQYVT